MSIEMPTTAGITQRGNYFDYPSNQWIASTLRLSDGSFEITADSGEVLAQGALNAVRRAVTVPNAVELVTADGVQYFSSSDLDALMSATGSPTSQRAARVVGPRMPSRIQAKTSALANGELTARSARILQHHTTVAAASLAMLLAVLFLPWVAYGPASFGATSAETWHGGFNIGLLAALAASVAGIAGFAASSFGGLVRDALRPAYWASAVALAAGLYGMIHLNSSTTGSASSGTYMFVVAAATAFVGSHTRLRADA
ncbi:MAG TPA: hypothetical protein VK070_03845 [Acidimicrobiia bacterium]|nr:hypothetical protein [Acidimicrobiia bacterium]